MKPVVRDQLVVVAVAAISFLPALGETRLWDQDEAYFARVAAEMYHANDWITPHFNGEMFGHKPPLMYWAMMAGYFVFGENHFAERFGSALAGIGSALVVYHLGCRFFSRRAGLWGAIAIGSCLLFTLNSRAAVADSYLTFFSALGVYWLLERPPRQNVGKESPALYQLRFTSSHWRAVVGYAFLGLATLAKGPIGFLMPMAVIGLTLMATTQVKPPTEVIHWQDRARDLWKRFGPANFFRQLWEMRPITATLTILVTAGWWFALVGWATEGAFLTEFFGAHYLERAKGAMDNHSGPIYYYVVAMLVGVFPWSCFTLPAFFAWRRHLYSPNKPAAVLLACWLVVYLIPFSLAATKLPHYILPCLPACALLIGCWFDSWLSEKATRTSWNWRAAMIALATVATLIFVTPFVLLRFDLLNSAVQAGKIASPIVDSLPLVGTIGGCLLIGGLLAWVAAECRQKKLAAGLLAGFAAMLMAALFGVLAPRVDQHQVSPQLAAQAEAITLMTDRPVASYQYFRPSLTYYFGQRVEVIETPTHAAEFFQSQPEAIMVIPADGWEEIQSYLPADTRILTTTPRFPEGGDVYLIGRKTRVANRY